jgi:hypothetical protein
MSQSPAKEVLVQAFTSLTGNSNKRSVDFDAD